MVSSSSSSLSQDNESQPEEVVGSVGSSQQPTTTSSNDGKPLEALCLATLQACQALTPAVEALYQSISSSSSSSSETKNTTKTKADDSVFTIADGLVQFLLTEVLLKGQHEHDFLVGDIVGEEDCPVQLTQKPYRVDDLIVPSEFEDTIDRAMEGVTQARQDLLSSSPLASSYWKDYYPSLTAFIDPIDGTREFSTQKGDQCSICVGFADTKTGQPVAGVVYRPLSHPRPTWAAGAQSEAYASSCLQELATEPTPSGNNEGSLLTTNGRISPFLEALMHELDYERVPSGGAGNKMLLLLEGKGTAYIQDRGVSRWDSCGAQAVLEAHGGMLCKLNGFLQQQQQDWSYTYRKTEENLDFEPGQARLTKYNAAKGIDIDAESMAMTPSQVKPYANLCGLVALGKATNHEEGKATILDGLQRAAEISPPAFD